jgi:hypothetical protein
MPGFDSARARARELRGSPPYASHPTHDIVYRFLASVIAAATVP